MTETFLTESTKFKIVPAPIQVPGNCSSCGSSNNEDRNYIDFDLTLDFYGAVYICTFCFSECANAVGYISPEQARRLEAQTEYYALKVANFYTKDKALNDAINLLRESGLFDLVDGPAGTSNEVPATGIDEVINADNSGISEGESDSNKQDIKQRSIDLSALGIDESDGAFNL